MPRARHGTLIVPGRKSASEASLEWRSVWKVGWAIFFGFPSRKFASWVVAAVAAAVEGSDDEREGSRLVRRCWRRFSERNCRKTSTRDVTLAEELCWSGGFDCCDEVETDGVWFNITDRRIRFARSWVGSNWVLVRFNAGTDSSVRDDVWAEAECGDGFEVATSDTDWSGTEDGSTTSQWWWRTRKLRFATGIRQYSHQQNLTPPSRHAGYEQTSSWPCLTSLVIVKWAD